MNVKKMPFRRHENILIFYKHLPTYNPQMEEGEPYTATRGNLGAIYSKASLEHCETVSNGKRYPGDYIIKNTVNNNQRLHPTQKPIGLLEYLILTYTNEGDTVLDNTMGSGSTGVAAVNTNRNFIGYELDEHYFEVAKECINNL